MDQNNNIQKAKPVPPFVRYCSAIIPTMFDDSLSYYEALCALNNFLQTNVIDTINNNAKVTEEYIRLTNELKEFVENYFDNLDVQEEINNKLDEMAEDGALTALVSEFFGEQIQEVSDALNNRLDSYESTINTQLAHTNDLVNALVQSKPVPVTSISNMTDTSLIYVLTTDGNWYYYNGNAWTIGGAYQASSLSEGAVGIPNLNNTIQQAIGLIALSPVWTTGKYLINGTYITQVGFSCSDPIQLKKGETIYFNAKGVGTNIDIIDTCDSEGNNRRRVVRSIDDSARLYSYTTTKNTYVILCSLTNGVGLAYIDSNIVSKLDSVVQNTINELIDVHINKTAIENNYYINSYGNKISHNYGVYSVTGFIDVSELSNYRLHNVWNVSTIDNQVCYAFYDANKNFISAVSMGGAAQTDYTFETPSNTKFFRSTVSTSNTETLALYLNEDIVSLNEKISDNNTTVETNTLFSSFNNFGVIGDSLASGESVSVVNGVTRYVDNYNYSWGHYIAEKYGMSCIHFSAGGLTTRSWLTSNVGLTKLQNSANRCNSYIIGLGVNDKNLLGDGYLGSIADIKENFMDNEDTYYGNYGKIISYIKQVQPKAKIFLLTMPDQTATSTIDYSNFNTAVRTIAGYFDNVYLIDLAGDHNTTFNSGFIRANLRGGHYNAIGYNYIGDKIYEWLSKYMLDNSANFRQIEFIGTDYSY